jgi:hypothetical protein
MSAEVPRDGAMHQLAIDPRDQGPDAHHIGRHGHTRAGMTLHVVGVTTREQIEDQIHRMIEQMPHPEGEAPLCGVRHMEDVGIWQTPYSGRDALRREIVRLRRLHRREVVLVHGYQHVGPCEVTA